MKYHRAKTVNERKAAMQKAKELQPKKPKEKEQPWRETHNHHYEFDKDLKRL